MMAAFCSPSCERQRLYVVRPILGLLCCNLRCRRFLGSRFFGGRLSGLGLGGFAPQVISPAQLGRNRLLSSLYRELGYGIDDPVEVFFAYGVEVGVGGGIHEVDPVGAAVFHRELY